jgi:hypothetical protein
MKKTIFFIILISLIACESPPVRRAQIIEEHPEWGAKMVKVINKGYLLKGMTVDQVKASWGRPCWSCTGTKMDDEWDKWQSWEYAAQTVFFDEDEKLVRWTKK